MAGVGIEETQAGKDELILVLNSGSSSLKFGIYSRGASDEEPLLSGSADGIGRSNGELHIRSSNGKSLVQRESILASQSDALAALAAAIREHLNATPIAVGHRVVHGGPSLRTHQLITPQVLDQLRSATHFAPLHIPQALALIASAQSIFPSAVHYVCFDDAFHRTMSEVASHLPLPQRNLDAGIRRYGFHGLSYESLVHHFGDQLPKRAIFAHLGNGASLCALRNGVSVDTTMSHEPCCKPLRSRLPLLLSVQPGWSLGRPRVTDAFVIPGRESRRQKWDASPGRKSSALPLSWCLLRCCQWRAEAAPFTCCACQWQGRFFLYHAANLAKSTSKILASRVVHASVIYLPVVLTIMMAWKS
jgi:hypothetical protein